MVDVVAEHERQGVGCLVAASLIRIQAVRATSLFVDLCTAVLQVCFSNVTVRTVSPLQRAQIKCHLDFFTLVWTDCPAMWLDDLLHFRTVAPRFLQTW
jgi:hypothetical protein